MADAGFQLKGSVLTVVVLELQDYDQQALATGLSDKVQGAPQFFVNSPVLLHLGKLQNPDAIEDFTPLLRCLRELGLLPVGFSAAPPALIGAVEATGLALLPPPAERASKLSGAADSTESAPATEFEKGANRTAASSQQGRRSRVITRPVRSGQQIYAEGSDLIVLSQVSEGAEVLADGNIHVYGALRGRALAGVQGDTGARIFCQSLEAELVAIAGNFLLQDGFSGNLLKKPAQISLANESLSMEPL